MLRNFMRVRYGYNSGHTLYVTYLTAWLKGLVYMQIASVTTSQVILREETIVPLRFIILCYDTQIHDTETYSQY
jgi:hypothetical protein